MHPTSNKHGPGSHFSMELYGSIFTSVHFIIIESSGVWLQSSCWMVQTFTHVQDVFIIVIIIFSESDVEFGIRVQKFVLSLRQDSEKGGEGQ